MSQPKDESKVEVAKRKSRYLRGTLAETLASQELSFGHDDAQVLKFHGVYQQDDRDARQAARATGQGKEYWFMVRTKIPGGMLTAEQYLAMDRLADQYAYNRSLRATTRQGFQLHGVLKGNLKPTLRRIHDAFLSTLAACGDVERNVMAPPAPFQDLAHRAVRELAREIAQELCPRTRAYHEIWLDGEKLEMDGPEEPVYGPQYLPRKFKSGIALPEDNALDIYSQDVGLIGILNGEGLLGVNILVGGGLGMTHRKGDTFARLGSELGYVEARHAVAAVRVIATLFRDHGNRADRRHARLKYLLEEWGMERFREEFIRRADFPLHPWVEVELGPARDFLGPHAQGDGRVFYGLWVPNGRIMDYPERRLKTAVQKIVEEFRPGVILTPGQNVLFSHLREEDISPLERILQAYGVPRAQDLSGVRRYALACPALPTCGLALSEAERIFPEVIDELEGELSALGLEDEPVAVRMTGCPNGCARPYTPDIGLVGRGPGRYDIYVGGSLRGDRLVDLYEELVPVEAVVPTLRPLLLAWSRERRGDEGLGDFYQRRFGDGTRRTLLTGAKEPVRRLVEERLEGVLKLDREERSSPLLLPC